MEYSSYSFVCVVTVSTIRVFISKLNKNLIIHLVLLFAKRQVYYN